MFSRLWNPGAKGQGRVHVRREERAPPAATSTDTATDTDTAANTTTDTSPCHSEKNRLLKGKSLGPWSRMLYSTPVFIR